ncbi:TPA: transglycosylase SLT domain-containing protein [Klebsiella pneumoniae subsp. pneumoniae]|nr:transglycosylase SLT domain-containing protein [Klebsiella pneumoniae subsp. pneumoniae]
MRIPTGNFGNVLPQAQPTRVDVGNTGAVGDAVAQLGRAGLGVAEDIQQRQEQDNQNALQALSTAGGAQVNKLLYDPETGMTATRKGINAVGATNDTLKEWDAWRDKQLSLLPPAARQRGGIILTAQRVQMERTSFVYEQGERERALQETYNASNNASIQRESLFYGDKISTQIEAGSRNQGIDEYGKAQGWPEEKIAFEKTLWQQKAASGAFDLFVSQQKQSMMGPGGALPTTGTPDLSQLASANMYVESRGQQFRSDGSPLVSGAGAVGIAQVMEKTGPEAAKYAGVEWSRERWLNDPQYNLQIGNAYFEHLGSKYSNNPVLTVAAYNAGPGMVDDWINGTNKTGKNESLTKIGDPRKGEISDAGFTAAIPLKETREHVQKVLGAAASIPPGATIGSISRMPFWNKMSPQDQSSAIDKMSALYDMRASAGRVALQSKMQDDLALLEAGKKVSPITPEAWASTLPVQATPAERMQLEQTFRHYQQAMSLQPVYQSIVQGTPQQGLAAVQALQPQESAPDFKYQQELYATAQGKLTQVLKAREADPGGWLQQYSPETQSALQQYQSGQVNGEYFVSLVQSEKDRFGITSKKVLPDAMADAISAKADSGTMKFSDFKDFVSGFGRYGDAVVNQLQPKTKAAVRVATSINDAHAADTIFTLSNVRTDELKKNAGEQSRSVDLAWNSLIAEASPTFNLQGNGGPETLSAINEQGKRLAYYYMASGEDAQSAAKKAYQKIIGDHYTIVDTWRMPNSLRLKENNVSDGLRNAVNSLKAEDIGNRSMFYNPMMTPEQNAANNLAQIKNSAEWVTDENEQGVYLTVNGNYIEDKSGSPVHMRFIDASKSGIANPSISGAVTNWMGEKRKVTPPSSLYTPNVNASMADAFRVIRGEDATSPQAQPKPDSPSNILRDALNTRGGQ